MTVKLLDGISSKDVTAQFLTNVQDGDYVKNPLDVQKFDDLAGVTVAGLMTFGIGVHVELNSTVNFRSTVKIISVTRKISVDLPR